jgi:hypothetical protein
MSRKYSFLGTQPFSLLYSRVEMTPPPAPKDKEADGMKKATRLRGRAPQDYEMMSRF